MKNIYYILLGHLKTPQYIFKNIWWRINSSISKEKLIFVIGTPRSGTTLLQKILESHNSLYSIHSETAIFSFRNFFNPKRNLFLLEDTVKNSILKVSKDNIDFFSRCVNYLNQHNKGKVFVEKTPQHIIHLSFLIKHFPNAQFVHILRDGRDSYCSALKHGNIPQSSSIKRFSKYYNKCLNQGIINYDYKRLYTIKYELLAQNPKLEIEKLMSFLNLEFENQQLDYRLRSEDKRAKREVFKKLNEPINTASIGKWKKQLTKDEKTSFNRYAQKALEFFGYSLN